MKIMDNFARNKGQLQEFSRINGQIKDKNEKMQN